MSTHLDNIKKLLNSRALHESEGNWTGQDCTEARREGALGGGQARACRRQPAAMPHVAAAARLARDACKAAHAGDRWNCSSVDLAPNYSPDLLTGGFRPRTSANSSIPDVADRAQTEKLHHCVPSSFLFYC
ncbi:hypothetical protein MSG28_000450 [Choristoneura fumiferana]|uniref:Uncharacterized protein n=1 Tax=Choristoneura fumiferana TaxID=7141 RepID=A0ACC0K0V3_CHOFU|nr:hypothetical protein MSG28_000450 [Choristoneura fumiferana]